jgi:hypothetical protein
LLKIKFLLASMKLLILRSLSVTLYGGPKAPTLFMNSKPTNQC